MRRLRLGVLLAGLVVAAVTFIPSVAGAASITFGVPGLELCGSLPQYQCDFDQSASTSRTTATSAPTTIVTSSRLRTGRRWPLA